MNILILGSNGREHAIAAAYDKSKKTKKIYLAPGNGLTDFLSRKIVNLPHIPSLDFDMILQAIKKYKIDLVDVAFDDALAAGFVDKLQKYGVTAFGPTKKAAQLEWSKEWSRNFMQKYKLPIPEFHTFTNTRDAIQFINKGHERLLFIKASGLALGKGVIKAETKEQAKDAILAMSQFGKSGETFLIEEGLQGEEFTFFAICDGVGYQIAKSSQDHKTIFNGDKGPNTGGVGCVSPTGALSKNLITDIEKKIIQPTLSGMQKEGRPYTGILYIGGMVTKQGIKIIEFNARWGDPEAEVILPGLQTDYLDLVQKTLRGNIKNTQISFDKKIRVSITGCANGYPTDYTDVKGKEIFGIPEVTKLPYIQLFGSGIKRDGKRFFVTGGRIFHLVAQGNTITEARSRAYGAMSMVYIKGNNLHYRTDIGWRELERKTA